VGEEVHNLALGVSSGIGAAGPSDPDGFTGKAGQRLFQFTLNRRRFPLKLKTGVRSALVFYQKGGPPRLVLGWSPALVIVYLNLG